MSFLATSSRCSSIGVRSHGVVSHGYGPQSRPLRPTFRLATKIPRSCRSIAVYPASTPINSYKTSHSIQKYARKYSSEPTEAVIEQTNDLPTKERIPRLPLLITAISVVPYVAFTMVPFAFPFEIAGKALFLQMTYGAVSLSMLGSVHWGLALGEYKRVDGSTSSPNAALPSQSDQLLRYVGGVLPPLASWVCLSQAPVMGMMGLMASFTALALFELGAHQARLLPSWYIRTRVPWTAAVLISLGINLIHLL